MENANKAVDPSLETNLSPGQGVYIHEFCLRESFSTQKRIVGF
jgi:hypothetical protein